MNKAAGIIAGVVVAAAVATTGGAWYTGTQLEPVLSSAIAQANRELASSLARADGQPAMQLELLSLDRRVFSSTARYRIKLHDIAAQGEQGSREWLLVDHIEHGPLPWSHVKALRLMPVMAASNFALERTADTDGWFAMSQAGSPLRVQVSLAYDGASDTRLQLLALSTRGANATVEFSGLTARLLLNADATRYGLTGHSDALSADIPGQAGRVKAAFKGLSFDTGGTLGASGMYLGHSDLKLAQASLQGTDVAPVRLESLSASGLMQEVGGNLDVQASYSLGALNYADQPIGALQASLKLARLDILASRELGELYRTVIAPQWQTPLPDGTLPPLRLSDAERQRLDAAVGKLLDAKPHLQLEKLSLATEHGESVMSVETDLANPAPLLPGSPAYLAKLIARLQADLRLSKPMLADLGSLQASLQGQTDPLRVAQAGRDLSATVAGLGQMLGLVKDEGEHVRASLHYSDAMVDFNGQKMPLQQFAQVLGQLGAMRQR